MGFSGFEDLSGVLAERYSVGFSQEIADQVTHLKQRDIQFLYIKELNDLAGEYRARIKGLVADYRSARSGQRNCEIRQFYASHESIFIRRQITDLWKVYRILMADSHELTAAYLAQLKSRKYQTSRPTGKECRAAA